MINGYATFSRAAIARALANDPPVIIADEPTGNLDSQTADQIFAIFNQLNRDGKTIIIVTHEEYNIGKCSDYLFIRWKNCK